MGLPASTSIPLQHFGVFFNWNRFLSMTSAILYNGGLHLMGGKGQRVYLLTRCFGCECTGPYNEFPFFAMWGQSGKSTGLTLVWMLPMGRVWFLSIMLSALAPQLAGSPLALLFLNVLLKPHIQSPDFSFLSYRNNWLWAPCFKGNIGSLIT